MRTPQVERLIGCWRFQEMGARFRGGDGFVNASGPKDQAWRSITQPVAELPLLLVPELLP